MYDIKDKAQSTHLITQLNLNRMPEIIIYVNELYKAEKFIKDHPYPLYVLRNPLVPDSKYFYIRDFAELQQYLEHFSDKIMISASINGFRDHKRLLGSICINRDDSIMITATKNKDLDHRTVNTNPDYDYKFDIHDKTIISKIPYFDTIYNYIVSHHLLDITVEFTVFDIEVGINKEFIVISELRNY
jgi:hypothetical protein